MNTFHNTLPIIKSGHTTAAGITHQNTMNIYEPSPVIIRTVHDIEKILEDIKQQSVVVAKPIEPIFNIYLNLNIEQHELMNKNAENNLQDDDDINNGPDELGNIKYRLIISFLNTLKFNNLCFVSLKMKRKL